MTAASDIGQPPPGEDDPARVLATQRFGGALRLLAPYRFAITAMLDGGTWILALALASWLRFEFDWSAASSSGLLLLGVLAGALQVGLGWHQGLYRGLWRFGSFEEVATLLITVLGTLVVVVIITASMATHPVPVGAVILAGPLALIAMATYRYGWRLALESLRRPRHGQLRRALVYGAGDAGYQLVRSMTSNPSSMLLPVGALDDNPAKQGHRLAHHVRVLGDRRTLAAVAEKSGAEVLVVAIPSASADQFREIVEAGEAAGLQVRGVPPLWELADAPVDVAAVRPVTVADLLGRHELNLDISAIAGYLTDRRVLVTGAGGSIGSELCRQVARFAPAELIMLDRDESALQELQLTMDDEGRVDDEHLVVADIRDRDRLGEVFARFAPEVIFHAAALKHVPLLELHPGEAVKTNVWGTRNVLEAARDAGVARFINISTDKAADPVNILGQSKLLAECLTAGVAQSADGTYLSVRFGNVLGSRGSMLTTFEHQVRAGGPVTVTHPDVTRYFMTIEEAVQLVIQAGAIGEDGDVLVLDMGDPVRIADVARRMAESVDPPVEIRFSGLRPGEKLTETLFADDEHPQPTPHQQVRRVNARPLAIDCLAAIWPPDATPAEALRDCVDQLLSLDDGAVGSPDLGRQPFGPWHDDLDRLGSQGQKPHTALTP